MKTKKLVMAVVALTMSATSAFAFTACQPEHTHEYSWTTTKEATCDANGEQKGTCECGDETTRQIDKLSHKYGDWQITAPTATAKGTAVKNCENGAHPLTVELPVLGDSAYKVQKVSETPTYTSSKYTYSHAEGDIVFTADAKKENVTLTVEQAVETANDAKYTALVGKGEGSRVRNSNKFDFLYEFGENYTHIKDDAFTSMEFWADKDAQGNIKGVIYHNGNYEWVNEHYEQYFDGLHVTVPVVGITGIFVGFGEMLEALYDSANANTDYNNEFTESVEDGVYSFSWTVFDHNVVGLKDEVTGEYTTIDKISDYIIHVSVEFTLDENYMLDSFTFGSKHYGYEYYQLDKPPYVFNQETGVRTPNEEDTPSIVNSLTVKQTALADIEELPVNKWGDYSDITASSFKLMHDLGVGFEKVVSKEEWDKISDDDPAYKKLSEVRDRETVYLLYKYVDDGSAINGTTSGGDYVYIDQILPDTANDYLTLNPVRAYLVDGNTQTLIYSSENEQVTPDENLMLFYNTFASSFLLRSQQKTGDFNIKVTVGNAECAFVYHVDPAAPASVSTAVNVYNEASGNYSERVSSSASVFANQAFTFKVNAGAPAGDTYLVDGRVSVTLADGTQNATVTATEDGYSFVATEAGEYVVNVVSLVDENVMNTLKVTVAEVPNVEEMLDGAYTAGDLTVTFDGENKTVAVSNSVAELTSFAYTYEEGVFTAKSADNNYVLELTENYKLVLNYKDEFGNSLRDVLKVKRESLGVEDAILGTWNGKFSYYELSIVFNADGTATFLDQHGQNAPLNYNLVDKGNGVYDIVFTEFTADEYYDNYGYWVGVSATGSSCTFNGAKVTALSLKVFDTADVSNEKAVPLTQVTVENEIVGTWKGSSGGFNYTVTFDKEGKATFDDSMGLPAQLTYELTNNGDGTYAITFSEGSFSGWYGVNTTGNTCTFNGKAITNLTLKVYDTQSPDDLFNVTVKK